MEFEKIKQFYRETWWLWVGYAIANLVAIVWIGPIFLLATPILIGVSIYFAVFRGPSKWPISDEPIDSQASQAQGESSSHPPK